MRRGPILACVLVASLALGLAGCTTPETPSPETRVPADQNRKMPDPTATPDPAKAEAGGSIAPDGEIQGR